MRRFGLERKLALGVVALFLVPTLVAGVVLLLLYRGDALADPATLFVVVLVGFVAMMAYLGMMAHGIGRALVRTLHEIQRGTELMATVNPDHRLSVATGDELEDVAGEINRMADRVREARTGLEAQVVRSTRELAQERAKLSAILDELDEGVVVSTLDARITLANRRAQELLGAPRGGILGRSLFDFVDRDTVAHFLDRLRAGAGGLERFALRPAGALVIEAGMTSFPDDSGGISGFILALRDASRPSRDGEARQRVLADALRELRGPLASVRSLSESLLHDAPGLGPERARLVGAIHAEAVRLSGLVAATGAASLADLARSPWHVEVVEAVDLARVTARRLGQDGPAPRIRVEVPPGPMRLRAEVSALSAALAELLRHLLRLAGPAAEASLTVSCHGRAVQIEAAVEGTAPPADLEQALEAPVAVGPAARLGVREIVRRHAGEGWGWSDAPRIGFRVTLPLEEVRETAGPEVAPSLAVGFVGAGTRSGADPAAPPPPRPELYDFSFFDEMVERVRPADRARALEDLYLVVLDVETTGLRPEAGDAIVSLAGVRVRRGVVKRSEVFDALVKPGVPIPPASVRFHGITDAMVVQAPPIEVVLPAFLRFAEGAVLVGHEVWLDLRFLGQESRRLGLPPLSESAPVLDTRLLAEVVHPSADSHHLDPLAARLGVAIEGRHSALGDALATAEIFVRLLPLLRKRGIVTLGQALEATRAVPRPLSGARATGGAYP